MSADKYDPYDFANRRHIGPSAKEIAEMAAVIGVRDLHALIDATVPASIRQIERRCRNDANSTNSARPRTRIEC